MKKNILLIVSPVIFLAFPFSNFAQAPNLGTTANFVLFSTTGAISNTGSSHITGNVGTNAGAISGFANVDGVVHHPDTATVTCATDLLSAYNQLNATIPTATHPVLLGDGETLRAGVYSTGGASSVNNDFILDAQGNENAVFIFQIGGAFSSGASAQIKLINCAKACNVFWKVEGAISLAAGTMMRGTLIANNAAISIGAGVVLEGRALSTTGAVALFGVLATIPVCNGSPILMGPPAPALASTACYALFAANGHVTNSGITTVSGDIGTNADSTTGYNPLTVTGTIHPIPDTATAAAAAGLANAYSYINGLSYDIELLYPAQFGNSLVLTPHTYLMNGAVTFTDTLFLNAQGNVHAVFVIMANGAFTTGTHAKVVLINGAQAKNVFWKIEGAVTINSNSDFKGTIICHNGAIVLNTGTTLEGRAFTTCGALTTTSINVSAVPAATISYADYTYCSSGGTATVTFSGTTGGTYSSTTGLVINSSSGAIDLAVSTPGTYTVTYSVAAAGACSASFATTSISIAVPPSATIAYPGTPFCFNRGIAAVTLTGTTGGIYFSLPAGASINQVTGTVDLAASVPGIYTITYTITRCASACGISDYTTNTIITINPNAWTGKLSSNWYTPGNWAGNTVPVISCPNVTILSGAPYQPILNSGIFSIQNLFINPEANLVVSNATLQISGTINNSGTFNTATGSIEMNGAVCQSIPANTFLNNALYHLIVSNGSAGGVALGGALDIYGSLTFPGTGKKLTTNDLLTLKSTVDHTAWVGDMTGNVISGKVNVERYFPARRAWRMLTAPVTSSNTIYNTWQNSGIYTPGLGLLVTGPTPTGNIGNGLDSSKQNNLSMKAWNYSTQAFAGITNTKVAISAGNRGSADNTGYLIFVRGDRNIVNTTLGYVNTTTINSIGALQTGTQTFPASSFSGKYTLIGNPYASPIDFNNVTLINLVKRFYVWDPTLDSTGAYVMMDDLSNSGNYTKTIAGSVQTKDIQSSQAFFVQTIADGAASITFNESSKSGNNNNLVFRAATGNRPAGIPSGLLRTSLYLLNADNSTTLADGTFAEFNNMFSSTVDMYDALKFSNINENLSIIKNTTSLAAERRPALGLNDTLYFKLATTTQRNYQFVFDVNNMQQPDMVGYLMDSYLGTSSLINLNGTTKVNFTINVAAASAATNRFKIVFKPAGSVLPVTFTAVKAYQQTKDIAVEWKVENELNMAKYDIEKSTDGTVFTQVTTINVTGNNNAYHTYSWLDVKAVEGNNFYRIKSYDLSGEVKYSFIEKVSIAAGTSGFSIYPNPVTTNVINLVMNNQPAGLYQLKLTDATGQVIFVKSIKGNVGNSTQSLNTGAKLAPGIYQLEITGENNNHDIQKVIVK